MVAQICQKLSLPSRGVRAAVELMNDGNTVPFIARYRKEATGCLDDAQLRDVAVQMAAVSALEARRQTIVRALEEQGLFTGELRAAVLAAKNSKRLEDLYLPHRPKRATRSAAAKDKGLAPLAHALLVPSSGLPPLALAKRFGGGAAGAPEDALAGARDILAEQACELPAVRDAAREILRAHGRMAVKARKAKTTGAPKGKAHSAAGGRRDAGRYDHYGAFQRAVKNLLPHQTLAISRGEAEGALSVALEWDTARLSALAARALLETEAEARGGRPVPRTHRCEVEAAAKDGVARLLRPAMERELRAELLADAQAHAVREFGRNLRSLLLQPPMPGQTVLGLDPGFRTGCKAAVVDPTGRLLETSVVFPHKPAPEAKRAAAAQEMQRLISRHAVAVVAIGNGTASGETEQFVARVCQSLREEGLDRRRVGWVVVSEAGASIYSASELAGKELPGIDVTLRGAVSIARRLQDPLSELVKIDPQHIGVGLYQHDVKEKRLAQELDGVVEAAVSSVGADINVASQVLLARIAGLGPSLAQRIIDHRDLHGAFETRSQLLQVKGVGKRVFEQCAGFLRVRGGPCALDNTPIHPESYHVVGALAGKLLGSSRLFDAETISSSDLAELGMKVDATSGLTDQALLDTLCVGEHTLRDILQGLQNPGQDVRGPPEDLAVRMSVRTRDSLRAGDTLQGTVRNVVDFGAFVDVGLGKDVLLHRSKMVAAGGQPVRNPHTVVSVGDCVVLQVEDVCDSRGHIGVTMADAPQA